MTEHDPLCPQHLQYPGHRSRCICVLLREADARARADERERWGLGWIAAADNVQALAHAEAVAAKLVEEVCRGEVLIQTLHGALIQAADQRDAARAEVAAHGLEVAQAHADAHREVLADLRAKVQGLRVVESRVKGRRITVLVDRDDVLALFDGGEDRD